jgi:hypothetical protein
MTVLCLNAAVDGVGLRSNCVSQQISLCFYRET